MGGDQDLASFSANGRPRGNHRRPGQTGPDTPLHLQRLDHFLAQSGPRKISTIRELHCSICQPVEVHRSLNDQLENKNRRRGEIIVCFI